MDSKTFVNIGFVEGTRTQAAQQLLYAHGIQPKMFQSYYMGPFSISRIYVLLEQKQQALDLLKQDASFIDQYCSK